MWGRAAASVGAGTRNGVVKIAGEEGNLNGGSTGVNCDCEWWYRAGLVSAGYCSGGGRIWTDRPSPRGCLPGVSSDLLPAFTMS